MAEDSAVGAPVGVPTVDIDKFCHAISSGTTTGSLRGKTKSAKVLTQGAKPTKRV